MPCLFNLFLWIQNRDLFAGDSFSLMFTTLDSMLKISVRLHVVVAIDAGVCVCLWFSCTVSATVRFVSKRRYFFASANRSIYLCLALCLLLHLFLHFICLFGWFFFLHLVGLIPVCVCLNLICLPRNKSNRLYIIVTGQAHKQNQFELHRVCLHHFVCCERVDRRFFLLLLFLSPPFVSFVVWYSFFFSRCRVHPNCAVFLSISLYILVVFGEVPLTLHYITFSRWPGLNTGHCFSCVLFSYLFTSVPISLSPSHLSARSIFTGNIFILQIGTFVCANPVAFFYSICIKKFVRCWPSISTIKLLDIRLTITDCLYCGCTLHILHCLISISFAWIRLRLVITTLHWFFSPRVFCISMLLLFVLFGYMVKLVQLSAASINSFRFDLNECRWECREMRSQRITEANNSRKLD